MILFFLIQIASDFQSEALTVFTVTAQRIGLGDSPLTEDVYSSIETEEVLEQLFNSVMNNGRDKEDKEEANQQDGKDETENQINDTSEERVGKKDNNKILLCDL